jgi:threonine/homoserine/homoserine lactone efflux protein
LLSWIKLVLGVLLIVIAVKQWLGRPAPGDDPPMPGWMQRIDTLGPGKALGLSILLAVVNPKNLLLIIGAGVAIAQAELSDGQDIVSVLVFTVVAACSVAIPTIAYLVLGARAKPALDRMKAWLSANNTAVMAVLLLVLGVSLFGKGLGGLT